jgi:hypothetical protein
MRCVAKPKRRLTIAQVKRGRRGKMAPEKPQSKPASPKEMQNTMKARKEEIAGVVSVRLEDAAKKLHAFVLKRAKEEGF